jgi:hypothetical protein
MPVEPEDWRLTGQERHLKGAALRHERYARPREDWDHDHCEFCWEKFSDDEGIEALREGYVTADDRRWICPTCFSDFSVMFEWVLTQPGADKP